MERQQSAATLIQSHFRRLLTQQRYLRMTQACIKLQAAFRRHMQCSRFNRMRNAALTIQGHYRYHALRQQTRNAFLAKKAAAVVIQRGYRQHRERKARTVCAVTVIQAAVRGWLMRLHFARLWEAASTLQANVRGYLARRRYGRLRRAAVTLQQCYRAQCSMRKCVQWYQEQRRACVMLQAAARGWTPRKRVGVIQVRRGSHACSAQCVVLMLFCACHLTTSVRCALSCTMQGSAIS